MKTRMQKWKEEAEALPNDWARMHFWLEKQAYSRKRATIWFLFSFGLLMLSAVLRML